MAVAAMITITTMMKKQTMMGEEGEQDTTEVQARRVAAAAAAAKHPATHQPLPEAAGRPQPAHPKRRRASGRDIWLS